MKAILLDIYTQKCNVQQVSKLNTRQKHLLETGSKAIVKSSSGGYKDYSDSYTETYMKLLVDETNTITYIPIRDTLKEITNRKTFSKKYLNELKEKMKRYYIEVTPKDGRYVILDLKELLENYI